MPPIRTDSNSDSCSRARLSARMPTPMPDPTAADLRTRPTRGAPPGRLPGGVAATGLALLLAACASAPPVVAPADLAAQAPAAIAPPAGARPAFVWRGTGTQGYVCSFSRVGIAAWFPGDVQMSLADGSGKAVGTHIHDQAARWQAADGSRLAGVFAGRVNAPKPTDDVAWLLYDTRPEGAAQGALARVAHVQRLRTAGGTPPATGCLGAADLNKQVRVPFTADFLFHER